MKQTTTKFEFTVDNVAKWLKEFPKAFSLFGGKWFTAEDLARYLKASQELN